MSVLNSVRDGWAFAPDSERVHWFVDGHSLCKRHVYDVKMHGGRQGHPMVFDMCATCRSQLEVQQKVDKRVGDLTVEELADCVFDELYQRLAGLIAKRIKDGYYPTELNKVLLEMVQTIKPLKRKEQTEGVDLERIT